MIKRRNYGVNVAKNQSGSGAAETVTCCRSNGKARALVGFLRSVALRTRRRLVLAFTRFLAFDFRGSAIEFAT